MKSNYSSVQHIFNITNNIPIRLECLLSDNFKMYFWMYRKQIFSAIWMFEICSVIRRFVQFWCRQIRNKPIIGFGENVNCFIILEILIFDLCLLRNLFCTFQFKCQYVKYIWRTVYNFSFYSGCNVTSQSHIIELTKR